MIKFEMKIKENVTDEEVMNNMKKALYHSIVKMKELAIRGAPVDIGLLRMSIFFTPNVTDAEEYTLEDGVPYGAAIEYGSRPHWVPIQPLKEWAKRHGGDDNFAYAIQHKIAQVGTNAQPFFRPAFNEVNEIWMPKYFEHFMEQQNV